jgi:DNA-directed RNA polymerase subunit RPC12/RpoP
MLSETQADTYTPRVGEARCPHCGARALSLAPDAAVIGATLVYACPLCGGSWSEARHLGQAVQRHWLPRG